MNHNTLQDKVSLVFYQSRFQDEIEKYELTEQKLNFTALPSAALEKCGLESDRHPVVIRFNNKLAGFFVLHGREGVMEYSENKDAILLRAYSIQHHYQGKGIAKKSLELLSPFVKTHFPDKNEIILAVNHSNEIAQRVYRKTGFIDKGIRVTGRKGELFILHKEI